MNKMKLSLFLLIALALVFSGCIAYKPTNQLDPVEYTYDGDITVSQQGDIVVIGNSGDKPQRVYLMFYDNQSVLRCNLDYKAMPPGAKLALFLPEDFMTLVWESPS